ncbi:MAG: hypothetical protein VX574_08035 [Myxococcota bacterium]|nr:hypothetical protein [Myxococcota bacterium]
MFPRALARPLILLLLVASTSAHSGPETSIPPGWTSFESTAGRFRAAFPGTPVETTETRDTIVGNLKGYRFEVEDKDSGTFFLVEYRDLPGVATFFMSDDSLVRQASESLLEYAPSTTHKDEPSDFLGKKSRFLRFQLADETKQIRLAQVILVEKRLYLVIAGVPPTSSQEKLAAEFIASFEFWE